VTIVYHVCGTGLSLLMLKESGGVINSVFDDVIAMAREDGGMDRKQAQAAREYMQNSAATGIVIAMSVALLVKMIWYGAIMAWFWTDEVRRMFGEAPASPVALRPATQHAPQA
jgi:hypothetical protein